MAVYCANDDYCVSGTGFPAYDDVYTQSGVYNLKDYYVGSVNGYYLFYSNSGYWCLSDTLDATPCFLQGKYPFDGVCPDLTFAYVNASVCLTPTPTPTVGCDVFNFEAKFFSDVNPTSTPTPTTSKTPTPTPTPTSTNFCPNIYVDAFITGITPTQTPTPSITPTVRILRYRSNQIQCDFVGDVTFITVDSTINCPTSKQFQDCSNGSMYYTTNRIQNPSGGDITEFMIFQSTVDGLSKCITYLGNNSNYIGMNDIVLVSGPIGYSNLGQCSLCTVASTPTPTVTQTPTMTPSQGIVLSLCSTFLLSQGNIYSFNVNPTSLTLLPISNVSNWNDIANTQTKLFISTTSKIREWNISLNPFYSTFVRELNNTDTSITFGAGLFAISNTKLITSNVELGVLPQTIIEINLPSSGVTSLGSSNYTTLFELPITRQFAGDLLVTTNNKIILFTTGGGTYLSQYSYPDGNLEVDILISPTIGSISSVFVENGLLYVIDTGAIVYNISTQPPYDITVITSPGETVNGASNALSCNNVSFEFIQTTYYVYTLCQDLDGPQTYVYQTEPSVTTIPNRAFLNLTDNNCWYYVETTTSVPTNTVDDIVIFEGNYFTEVLSTVYTNCAQCIASIPCTRPSNLNNFSFKYGYDVNNGPNIFWPQSADEICSIVYSLYNDFTQNDSIVGFNGESGQAENLDVGSRVYDGVGGAGGSGCDCYDDGFYFVTPSAPGLNFTDGVIIEISGCIIISSTPCSPINGTSPTNPNTDNIS